MPATLKEKTMLYVAKEVSVNGSREPGEPVLSRSQVWKGLELKAGNALPFVAAMSKCEVVELTENGLVRDIEIRGQASRERITFYPGKKVVFLRLSGPIDGLITNEILEGKDGDMRLRFSFALQLVDADSGSPQEQEFGMMMERDYTAAVDSTLSAIRQAVNSGKL
ncbi:SRPBCC family protein [Pseudomonas fluorescens]|uniref:SRPBCC family protein n=1 Tax=Pseudomonas fluorescens TaxID=294 RepID=UPI001CD47AB8|nr:SRPBCC family protein [Pseudomonas fluorescens]